MRERLRQFHDAGQRPGAADFELAHRFLAPPLLALFEHQHPRDIVHSAGTARWLIERGHDSPDLVAAALLHDVGKGPQRRSDRTLYVLAGALHLAGVAASPASRLETRRAIARSLDHSEAGAALIAAAGGSARLVNLTRLHHSIPAGDPVLALLEQADAAN
jgi:hypothetical protein